MQISQLFQNCAAQLQTISELRIGLVGALRSGAVASNAIVESCIATLTRHIRLFGKFFRRIQQLDAPRFVALPNCSDLILYYWSKVVQATNSPPDFIEGLIKLSPMPIISAESYVCRFSYGCFPSALPCPGYGPVQRKPCSMGAGQKRRV